MAAVTFAAYFELLRSGFHLVVPTDVGQALPVTEGPEVSSILFLSELD